MSTSLEQLVDQVRAEHEMTLTPRGRRARRRHPKSRPQMAIIAEVAAGKRRRLLSTELTSAQRSVLSSLVGRQCHARSVDIPAGALQKFVVLALVKEYCDDCGVIRARISKRGIKFLANNDLTNICDRTNHAFHVDQQEVTK